MRDFTLIEWLITFLILLIIGTIVFAGVNSIGIDTKVYSGSVRDKHYQAGYTTVSTTVVDGVARTSSTYHSPEYKIYVNIEGERITCNTTEGKYSKFNIGSDINIKAGQGRLIKSLVCKGVI